MRGLCGVYEMSIVTPSQNTGIAITLAPRRRSNFVQTQSRNDHPACARLSQCGILCPLPGTCGYRQDHPRPGGGGTAQSTDRHDHGRRGHGDRNAGGQPARYHYRKVVDRFIHNVTKTEETAEHHWADHRLTTACREGYTLIYDEFTRSRPEANNVLLSVLEEGLLVLPAQNQNEPYITVHPNFRVIFTSNPQEYAGVHEAQDALGDRIVTIDMGYADRELEIAIAAARSGLPTASVTPIVDLVQEFRSTGEYDQTPTLRSSIMICRMVAQERFRPTVDDPHFVQVCLDILGAKSLFDGKTDAKRMQQHKMLLSLIEHHCPACAVIGGTDAETAHA